MKIIDINCFGYAPVPAQWHKSFYKGVNRLYIFDDAGACFTENGVERAFKPRTLYFLPALSHVIPNSKQSIGKRHTYIDFELSPPVMTPHALTVDIREAPQPLKAAVVLFQSLARYTPMVAGCFENESVSELVAATTLYIIQAIIQTSNADTVQDQSVLKAIQTMHNAPIGSVTVENLAKQLYLTPDSLIRRFKKVMGLTPYQYYKQLRTRTARYMLENGKTLEFAAGAVGYSDSAALLHAMQSI